MEASMTGAIYWSRLLFCLYRSVILDLRSSKGEATIYFFDVCE